ncbi:MATE family efflux transporter [Nodosilinea sp. LEGE 07088]|uniref:MATE family efflux transporter n=1 Tax=Nodosilinea sp. LEGE 07088 TaxID=2777968 RepID=UPI0018824A16|nr:MATE family efflux transporter [Nodosilinea sp. LEGE 07088]MBE9136965.1 MATE family efflux transporter [Nodosilinea sp. LEGE 07088]
MRTQKRSQAQTGAEIQAFLALAVPLAGAQVAQAVVGFIDTLMMGRLGAETLAAGGLAAICFQLLIAVVGGFVMAVGPLVAEAFGARNQAQVEAIARQGFWLALALSLPLMLVLSQLDGMLRLLGQPTLVADLAAPYFKWILWGALPALGFALLRGYASALSQAQVVIAIVLVGTGFNIAGNYALGFGNWGFPALGLGGLGLASGLSYWLMFGLFLLYILKHPQLKQYRFWRGWYRVNPPLIRRLLGLGGAIAVTIALEFSLFVVVTFLMGLLGPEVLAAHQTVYQTIYLIFMVPLGMSYAVTARVGQAVGQQDRAQARQAGYVAMAIAAVFMLLATVGLLLFRRAIIGLYIDVDDPANANVVALAMPMLQVAALAELTDGVQRVAAGALYGLQDTRIPMVLSGLAFWGVGLTTGYLLGFIAGWGGVGLWIGQSIGVATAGIIFVARFHRLTRPKPP